MCSKCAHVCVLLSGGHVAETGISVPFSEAKQLQINNKKKFLPRFTLLKSKHNYP